MSTTFTIKLAGHIIEIAALYPSTKEFCRDYLTDEKGEFLVVITPEDIAYERNKSAKEDEFEGIPMRHFSKQYLETLAVYRKIVTKLLDYDILLFHGSVVAVDGVGYLFTAKSGTGKSTHTSLWRTLLGERAIMINDDKPLLEIRKEGVIVYGTPWDGKHRLSCNASVPLKAICILQRDANNHIEAINRYDAWPMLLQQSYRRNEIDAMQTTLALIDKLSQKVDLYCLGCNMELEAAKIAYQKMSQK